MTERGMGRVIFCSTLVALGATCYAGWWLHNGISGIEYAAGDNLRLLGVAYASPLPAKGDKIIELPPARRVEFGYHDLQVFQAYRRGIFARS